MSFLYSDIREKLQFLFKGNVNEMPLYFDMPSNYTIDDAGTKSVHIKTSESGKNATDYDVDGFGPRHNTTMMCGVELKDRV
jgi:hypothetical protein